MKKLISIILSVMLLLCLIPVNAFAASGSIKVSKSSITVEKGKTSTFTITASNAAGRVDIASSNTSVAKVNKTSEFLDNSSVTVTVTAVGSGTANITVTLTDVADYDGNELTGTKTVKITVPSPTTKATTKATTKPTTTKATTKPTTKPTTTTTKPISTEPVNVDANLRSLSALGYSLSPAFSPNQTSYKITVPADVSSVNVNAAALKSSSKVDVFGADKFTAGQSATMRIVVTAADGTTKTYTITTVVANEETTVPVEEETTTEPVTQKVVGLDALSVFAVKDVTPEIVAGVTEYTVSVPVGTNALTVDATGSALDGATVTVEGADNLAASNNTVTLTATAEDGTQTVYTIHVVYDQAEVVTQEAPTQIVEKSGVPIWLVIIIALLLLILGLVLGFLFGKKKGGNDDGPDDNGGTGFVFGNANDDEAPVEEDSASDDMFGSSGMNFNPPSFGGFTPAYEETASFNPDAAPAINEPVYTAPAVEPEIPVIPVAPLYTPPVAEPVVEPVAPAAPLYTPPVAEPVVEPAVPVAPVYEAPVVEPVAEPAIPVAPVYETPVVEPVAEPAIPVAPIYEAPVVEPVAEPAIPVAPVYEAPVAEPIAQPAIPVAPVYEAPVAEPIAEPAIPVAPAVEPETTNPFEQSYVAPTLPYEAGAPITDESVAYAPPEPVNRSPFGF